MYELRNHVCIMYEYAGQSAYTQAHASRRHVPIMYTELVIATLHGDCVPSATRTIVSYMHDSRISIAVHTKFLMPGRTTC